MYLSVQARLLLVAVGLAALFAKPAWADQTARLVYARGAGADGCPDEADLRRAVASRLGYDPFRPVAPLTVIASVTHAGSGFHGEVRLLGEQGDEVGSRSIGNGSARCEEVIEALALTVSVAIDPLLLTRPPPPGASATESPPKAPAPPSPPPAPVPAAVRSEPPAPVVPPQDQPNRTVVAPFLAAALVGSLGSAPTPAFGVAAGAGVRLGRFSFEAEARADVPSPSASYPPGSLSSFLVLGTLVPCVHLGAFLACAAGSAGVLTASSSGIKSPLTARAPYVAVGPRVGAEVPFAPHWGFRATLDLGIPLLPTSFGLAQSGGGTSTLASPAYSPPPIWAALELGAAYHF